MESSKPIISIIVPIYNVEKYLDRCLKSIQNQSFTNFEVIMTDNTSADRSAEIAQHYVDTDSRFQLFSCENKGASVARNYAYTKAQGDYIAFVDSDDYIAPDFLMRLYTAALQSNAEITMCHFALNFEPENKIKDQTPRKLRSGVFSRDEAIALLLKDNQVRFFIWNKLWKREFLEKTQVHFLDMFYEDIVFCVDNFLQINTFCITDYLGYFYTRQTKTFLEVRMTFERIDNYIASVGYMREFLEKADCFEQFHSSFRVHANHVRFSIPILVIQANHSSEQKVKVFRTIIQKLKQLSYYTGKKFRLEPLKSQEGEKKCPTTTHLQ